MPRSAAGEHFKVCAVHQGVLDCLGREYFYMWHMYFGMTLRSQIFTEKTEHKFGECMLPIISQLFSHCYIKTN